MNKKAWIGILTVIFVGITISIVVAAYYKPYTTSEVMGRQQAAIMEAYSVGEQARRYSSDAAHMAAQQALYKLGKNGGYYSDPPCSEASGYAIWGGGCTPSDEEILTNFKALFDEEFHKYLSGFKLPVYMEEDSILPTLGTEAEEQKTLYDVVEYNREIKVENGKIIIEGFPVIDEIPDVEYIYDEETGELEDTVEVTYTVESAIMISSELYAFEYILDPHFETELDIDLYEIFKESKAKKIDSDDKNYEYYEYDTGKKVLTETGEESLVVRFAKTGSPT